MIGRTNTGGGGVGGVLTVTAPAGVTVEVSKDGKVKRKTANAEGLAVFKGLETGTWTLTATDGVQTSSKTIEITTDYNVAISFNAIPEFTYTGDFEIVNDSDEQISVSQDNWKIRLLTSGTLKFTTLGNADAGIDVFCVGGGGGSVGGRSFPIGGGGGYTCTGKNIAIEVGKDYEIIVGTGGSGGNASGQGGTPGGTTSAFDVVAAGGINGTYITGGNGGSGGGGNGGSGGYNGSDGTGTGAGKGQINASGPNGETGNTSEFGEDGRTLYAGGGAGHNGSGGLGGGGNLNSPGATNTGGGAGGGGNNIPGQTGGSGIVIIRNKR